MQSSTAPIGELPTPEQRPNSAVVIYDGECRFCISQVERLARWDRRGVLSFVSLHDPIVARRWPNLSHDQLMEQMYIVDNQGNYHEGARAFRYLTRHVPRLWLVAPLLHVPFSLPLWQCLYREVARRRYKLMGDQTCDDEGTCHIHFGS